jgi:hypothetical protein
VAEELFRTIRNGIGGEFQQHKEKRQPKDKESSARELERFAAMFEKGILTSDEFQQVKRRIIEGAI